MQSQTIAENNLERFDRWVLAPLRALVANQQQSHVAAFILISVAIDELSTMRYRGEIPDREHGPVRRRYEKFITTYFPTSYKEHAPLLYNGFRCKLVHEFQLEGIDIQQDEASKERHLKRLGGNIVCLNSTRLLEDLVSAFERLKRDLIGPTADPAAVSSFEKGGYKRWTHTPL